MSENGTPSEQSSGAKMEMAIIGLGRMGGNMVKRLAQRGHRIVGYARTPETVKQAEADGGVGASSVEDLVSKLSHPRTVWVMIPAGKPTDDTIHQLGELMEPGDLVIDGGNSNWKDSKRHSLELKEKGIHFMDAGTSGGVWGLTVGYSLMVGGEREDFERVEPILKDLAPENGYGLMGPAGSGHFVKMVHNGIEYGMLAAYGEGYEILHASEFDLDLKDITRVWQNGSVVRSWLLDLMALAFEAEGSDLKAIRGYVEDSGEGLWTVEAALEEKVPAPIITLSLLMRFASRQEDSFSAKVIAALRNQFGGHKITAATGSE
ncbi:MAG TPA: decarboxylating 6-phosphogluconate dehydrogenase [Candidatus Dormibacteraeota bacterium]|jgi:6-phosphogluconate dehydrogenase|nr:decarboxylating 6-phosphogluconate dehydrogenase [Candidatus Dormibacteraeota bacterium]